MLLAGTLTAQETKKPETKTNQDPVSETEGTLAPTVVTGSSSIPLKPENLASPRYTAPLRDIPRTVTIVPKALLQQQNATTINDALRNVPGISLQSGEGGTPAGDQLTMRGFSARNDFFVDGIRDIGGYTRDTFNYEQVEVAKGPNSTDSGRGSTGGAINLVTKTPSLTPSLSGSLGAGTDAFGRATLDYNRPIEALEGAAFRLNLLTHTEETPGRDDVENQRWGIAPSIAFGLGSDTVTTISYMHMAMDNQPDYGIPWVDDQAPPVDFSNYYGLLERDYEHVNVDILTGEVRHTYNENLDLRAIARYGRNHRDSFITAPRLLSGTTDTVRRSDFKTRYQTNEIMSLALDANYRFETGKIKHTLVTGADYTRERDENVGRTDNNLAASPNTPLNNPDSSGSYPMDVAYTGTSVGRANTLGIFLYDTIKFNDQWTLNGGLRYDHIDSEYSTSTDNLSRTDDIVSWRSAITYKPVEKGTIYFAYGTSASPSVTDSLNLDTDTQNLDPEETETFELGTKWDLLDQRLGLTAAIFKTNKTNGRTSAGRGQTTVLSGEQEVQGVELGITGKITDQWSIFGGYTYLDSEITSSEAAAEVGNPLPNTPEHSFSIWTNYDVNDKLTLGGGARYVGDRFSNGSNTRTAESFITYDAAVSYKISETITAQLNVYNLANERYIDFVGGGHFIPGEGRSAAVTLRFEF